MLNKVVEKYEKFKENYPNFCLYLSGVLFLLVIILL